MVERRSKTLGGVDKLTFAPTVPKVSRSNRLRAVGRNPTATDVRRELSTEAGHSVPRRSVSSSKHANPSSTRSTKPSTLPTSNATTLSTNVIPSAQPTVTVAPTAPLSSTTVLPVSYPKGTESVRSYSEGKLLETTTST